MEILSKAAGYLVSAFSKNEHTKTFKNDMLEGFFNWIRPIFLKDDPSIEEAIKKENGESKKAEVINAKLVELSNNEDFARQLEQWIQKIRAAEIKEKNILEDVELNLSGDITIGDASTGKDDQYHKKNKVSKSKLTGNNFRLGDG